MPDTLRIKTFCRNRSILHHCQDKCVFTFYTEVQDGPQKREKLASRLQIPCGSKISCKVSILHRYRETCIFAIYAEIQDRENDFWENWPVHCADILWVQKFVEIALFALLSRHIHFCELHRNSR